MNRKATARRLIRIARNLVSEGRTAYNPSNPSEVKKMAGALAKEIVSTHGRNPARLGDLGKVYRLVSGPMQEAWRDGYSSCLRSQLASKTAEDADLDEAEAYTAEVAKLVRKKKGELGISSFRQNYKGKGSQRAIRQIWMRFKNGAVIDVWIHPGGVKYGGVVSVHPSGARRGPDPSVRKTTDNAKKTADTIADDLKEWMES